MVIALAAACLPLFPLQDGWLGGDAAYSVPLSENKSLWLFGDTFVGKKDAKVRAGSKMVANSAAVSECKDGKWSLSYHERRPFFPSDEKDERFWPLDGFAHDGKLYVALSRVRADPSDALGFKTVGVTLATLEPDLSKKPKYRALHEGPELPGAAIVVENGYAYFFASAAKNHDMLLARLPLNRLKPPLEFLKTDGTWKKGRKDAKAVMTDGATEMSVRRAGRGWVAVMPGSLGAPAAFYRTAPALEGPWTDSKPLVSYEARPKGDFCYAAKEHAELRGSDGSMVVTYACNSMDFGRLTSDMSLYVPRAVVVAPPPDL